MTARSSLIFFFSFLNNSHSKSAKDDEHFFLFIQCYLKFNMAVISHSWKRDSDFDRTSRPHPNTPPPCCSPGASHPKTAMEFANQISADRNSHDTSQCEAHPRLTCAKLFRYMRLAWKHVIPKLHK